MEVVAEGEEVVKMTGGLVGVEEEEALVLQPITEVEMRNLGIKEANHRPIWNNFSSLLDWDSVLEITFFPQMVFLLN